MLYFDYWLPSASFSSHLHRCLFFSSPWINKSSLKSRPLLAGVLVPPQLPYRDLANCRHSNPTIGSAFVAELKRNAKFESFLLHFYCQCSPWNSSSISLAVTKQNEKTSGVIHGWRQTGWAKRSEHVGAAFFSLLSPADTQENLFWWSDFLREASGVNSDNTLSRNSLYLKVSANHLAGCYPTISKKRTVT